MSSVIEEMRVELEEYERRGSLGEDELDEEKIDRIWRFVMWLAPRVVERIWHRHAGGISPARREELGADVVADVAIAWAESAESAGDGDTEMDKDSAIKLVWQKAYEQFNRPERPIESLDVLLASADCDDGHEGGESLAYEERVARISDGEVVVEIVNRRMSGRVVEEQDQMSLLRHRQEVVLLGEAQGLTQGAIGELLGVGDRQVRNIKRTIPDQLWRGGYWYDVAVEAVRHCLRVEYDPNPDSDWDWLSDAGIAALPAATCDGGFVAGHIPGRRSRIAGLVSILLGVLAWDTGYRKIPVVWDSGDQDSFGCYCHPVPCGDPSRVAGNASPNGNRKPWNSDPSTHPSHASYREAVRAAWLSKGNGIA